MSFEILNKLFPEGYPSASDFFSCEPQHGFTVSVVKTLTHTANYKKAYEKFIKEHWAPTRVKVATQEVKPPEAPKAKPALSLKK